jgi:hypothetical protein
VFSIQADSPVNVDSYPISVTNLVGLRGGRPEWIQRIVKLDAQLKVKVNVVKTCKQENFLEELKCEEKLPM